MDVLDPNVPLDLLDDSWKIYSRNPVMTPHYAGPNSQIQNSMVAEGCEINGMVDFAVLFAGVVIDEGAIVRDSIIMPNTVIEEGVIIRNAMIGEGCIVRGGAVIGGAFRDGETRQISVVGKDHTIDVNQVVKPGEVI